MQPAPSTRESPDIAAGSCHSAQCFLFLQGPVSPFFVRLANRLERQGHRVLRINLCFGDWLFWRRQGAVNYRGGLRDWPEYVARMMDMAGVTDLILLGEQRAYHRAAILAAQIRGIRVSTTDFGYLRPDWITLEPDGMSALSRFPREAEAIRALAAATPPQDLCPRFADSFALQAAWDVAYHLLSWLFWFLYPGYRSHQIHHPVATYLGTGWRLLMARRRGAAASRTIAALAAGGRPWWIFPMQMEVDFSLRAYSPFADGVAALEHVVGSFARHAPADGVLVVKIHPLDPGLRDWRRHVRRLEARWCLEGRILYLDGGSLDALLAGGRGLVTVNSTAGIWALRAGIPVVTLGAAIYDVKGLAWQGGLDMFWQQATPPEAELTAAFIAALAGTIQLRGGYYSEPGLSAAVREAAERLEASAQMALMERLGAPGGNSAKAPRAAIRPQPPGRPGYGEHGLVPVPVAAS